MKTITRRLRKLELLSSVHHVPPIVGRDSRTVHFVNQVVKVRQGRDRGSFSVVEHGGVFAGNS
jgi:hypothetical protein